MTTSIFQKWKIISIFQKSKTAYIFSKIKDKFIYFFGGGNGRRAQFLASGKQPLIF
jgi:hypothetical protein